MDSAEGRLDAVEERLTGIVVTENSITDGEVTFSKYDDTALSARVKTLEDNPYTLPENVVQDADYKHITVTSTSVSDGVNTFEKYVLPSDVVQDANYTTRMSAVEEGVAGIDNKIQGAKDYADAIKATLLGDNEKLVEAYDTLEEIGN
jgi:hypothetical protein